MISADIKINNRLIYRIEAVRYPNTKPKGLNPYQVELFNEKEEKIISCMVVHGYEDGPIHLISRMAQGICQNSTLTKRN